jgi:uncharacterized membrane protein YeaQ/YmgE (transglycosylase-associated protein family)
MCLIVALLVGIVFLIAGVATFGLFISLIPWLIIGLIVGAVASAVTESRHGILGDIGIGLAGSFIGGVLFALLFHVHPRLFSLAGILAALVGAVILLLMVRLVSRPA